MNKKSSIIFFKYLLSLIIFLSLWGILSLIAPNLGDTVIIVIAVLIAYIFTPKLNFFNAQTGKKVKMTWVFLKRAMFFNL